MAKRRSTKNGPPSSASKPEKRALKPRVRDNNSPKKPVSAYFLWFQNNREKFAERIGSRKPADLCSYAGSRWKEIDTKVKKKYEQKATRLREDYTAEMEAYVKTPQHAAHLEAVKSAKRAMQQEPGSMLGSSSKTIPEPGSMLGSSSKTIPERGSILGSSSKTIPEPGSSSKTSPEIPLTVPSPVAPAASLEAEIAKIIPAQALPPTTLQDADLQNLPKLEILKMLDKLVAELKRRHIETGEVDSVPAPSPAVPGAELGQHTVVEADDTVPVAVLGAELGQHAVVEADGTVPMASPLLSLTAAFSGMHDEVIADAIRQDTPGLASMSPGTPDSMSAFPAANMPINSMEDDFHLELSTSGSEALYAEAQELAEDEVPMFPTPGYRYWLGKRWDGFQSDLAPCPDDVVRKFAEQKWVQISAEKKERWEARAARAAAQSILQRF